MIQTRLRQTALRLRVRLGSRLVGGSMTSCVLIASRDKCIQVSVLMVVMSSYDCGYESTE
jgi:hypothetical protein